MTAAGVTTLPLYRVPTDRGGSFQLRLPGGSESWQLTADADDRSLRIVIRFLLGCTRHHAQRPYASADRAYRRRPTVVPPPVPANWPCVHVQLFRGESLIASLFDDTATQSTARVDTLDVTIAGNRLWASDGGGLQVHAAPRTAVGRTLSELSLIPADPAAGWQETSPLLYRRATAFRVTGVLRGFHAMAGDLPESLAFSGTGHVEHALDYRSDTGR